MFLRERWDEVYGRRTCCQECDQCTYIFMIALLPPNAPNANPPPKNLPTVVISGVTPNKACRPPGLSRDVWTSSKMRTAPTRVASSRRPFKNDGSPGIRRQISMTVTHAATCTQHWLYKDNADLLLYRPKQRLHALKIVIRRDHKVLS